MLKRAGLLICLTAATLQAGIIASVTGPSAGASGNRVFAVSWTQTSSFDNVTVAADLFAVPQAGVTATAWLTTAVGAGATVADQLATTTVTSDTIFTGLSLSPNTYFLVISISSGAIAAGWNESTSGTASISTAPGVTVGPSRFGTFLDFPSFGPSENLVANTDFRLLFSVTNTATTPEPGSFLLFATGFLVLAVFGIRRARLA